MVHSSEIGCGVVRVSINETVISSTLFENYEIDLNAYTNGDEILHTFCLFLERKLESEISKGATNFYGMMTDEWLRFQDQLIPDPNSSDHSDCCCGDSKCTH